MSMHRSLAAGLWLLAAAGAYAVAVSWADDAQTGKVHPWVLVVVFWGAAAVSVAIHHISHYLADQLEQAPDALKRSRRYLVQGQRALRHAQMRLAQERDLLGRMETLRARGGETLNAVRPVLHRTGDALRSSVCLQLIQGRDLLRRSWRQHADAEAASAAGRSGHPVEIGS